MNRGKQHSTEQIIKILREIKVYTSQDQSTEQAVTLQPYDIANTLEPNQ